MELDQADVVVVGAGIAGMSTAFALKKRGFDVVVVDQRFAAFGATGRSSGCVWIQTAAAGPELDLARKSVELYRQISHDIGDTFDFRPNGGLLYFTTDDQKLVLGDYVAERRASGIQVDMLSVHQAREQSEFVPEDALGAVFCQEDTQLDTAKFTRALADIGRRQGIRVYENTPTLGVVRRADAVTGVRTVRGTISAGGVVWATGAWTAGAAFDGLELPIVPVRMGMLITQPVPTRTSTIVHGPEGVAASRAIVELPTYREELFRPALETVSGIEYEDVIVQQSGGSIVIGHTYDPASSLNPHITMDATRLMLDTTLRRHPDLATLGVVGLWAGLVGVTADRLPIIDQVNGVFLNTGHISGAATGAVSGELTAQLVAGEKPTLPMSPYASTRTTLTATA